MKIYHNARCSKSRQGLSLLENSSLQFEVVDYIKNPPKEKELREILKKLGIKPLELVRKNESVWKEKFKGKTLSDTEVIQAMISYPKLIERPIVIKGDRAVIGRPTEKIDQLLSEN